MTLDTLPRAPKTFMFDESIREAHAETLAIDKSLRDALDNKNHDPRPKQTPPTASADHAADVPWPRVTSLVALPTLRPFRNPPHPAYRPTLHTIIWH